MHPESTCLPAKADNVHQQLPQLCGSETTQMAKNDKAEADNDETKAKGDELEAENGEAKAENGHPNDNVKDHTENEVTKSKADDTEDVALEPIPVYAEKIAKLSVTEEKSEDEAKKRQVTTTTNVSESPGANDSQKSTDFVASSGNVETELSERAMKDAIEEAPSHCWEHLLMICNHRKDTGANIPYKVESVADERILPKGKPGESCQQQQQQQQEFIRREKLGSIVNERNKQTELCSGDASAPDGACRYSLCKN